MNYYDDYGRLASQYRQHYLQGTVNAGNYDRIVNTYNFEGAITASTRQHYVGGVVGVTVGNDYVYDHVGRKLQSAEMIDGNDKVLLVDDRYNELGQLKERSLHNNGQLTSYAYNERGWLKGTRSPQFSQELYYEAGGVIPQFNGNISAQNWGTGTDLASSFTYGYDALNRLTSGVATRATVMSELVSYDVMGNIKNLNRDGIGRDYSYVGNQLQSVTGMGAYAYDANGNATTDGRSGNVISYNRLNLPSGVAALGLSYVYDATGNKLKKKIGSTVTDYIGGIQYTNGVIELIQTETGVARKNGSVYSYEYNLTDHLGNVRSTFYKNPSGGAIESLQSDDYYAFGLRKLVKAGTNKYLYNGKELQEELGQYDYGARFYDPVIGRWNVVDPLAEKGRRWSPYVYGFNNPIRFTDPDGMWPDGPGDNDDLIGVQTGMAIGGAIRDGIHGLRTLVAAAGDALGINKASPGMKWQSVDSEGGTMGFGMAQVPSQGGLKDALGHLGDGANALAFNGSLAKGTTGILFAKTGQEGRVASEGVEILKTAVHANSKASTLENTLYRLETTSGDYLKTGITSKAIPEKRYTNSFMNDKVMKILNTGSRSDMLKQERSIVESNPGPLNRESWAGKNKPFYEW